jgi:hypothetical protein
MEYRAFEQRLLDTIFTTDVPINPATIAFLYKVTVQEASDLLQQAAVHGLLNIESDEEGNILYVFPNRQRIPGKDGKAAAAGQPGTALARLGSDGAGAALTSARTPILPPEHIDMVEAASGTAGLSTSVIPGAAARLNSAGMSAPASEPAQDAIPAGAQTTRCRFCAEVILVGAKKCKHCHEYLDDAMRELQVQRGQINQLVAGQAAGHATAVQTTAALVPAMQAREPQQLQHWNTTTSTQAALLSFFVPGLGQMCSGRVPAGLLWMMFTCLGYVCFIVPGIVLHILCVINASRQPQQQLT